MGGSGCGKTRLAMNLENFYPNIFKRTLEVSTREIRENEIDGVDYKFLKNSEFEKLSQRGALFEKVEYQFYPAKYGAEYAELDENKWNVMVVSIEGFLSALKNIELSEDTAVLINILNDDTIEVNREGRDPGIEEKINISVLQQFLYDDEIVLENFGYHTCKYIELKLSELKLIRNDSVALKKYLDKQL